MKKTLFTNSLLQTIPGSTNILEASSGTVLFPLLLILTLFIQLLTSTKLHSLTLTFVLSLHTVHLNCRLLSHCPLLLQLSVTLPSLVLRSLKLCHLLDSTKAMGIDGIGPRLLKECAHVLYLPFHYLFCLSLEQHSIPQEW